MMWAAMEETGVGALVALAVGAAAVPVGEEMEALPRTASRPYGRSCLLHDQSSSDLPGTPLLSELTRPRNPSTSMRAGIVAEEMGSVTEVAGDPPRAVCMPHGGRG